MTGNLNQSHPFTTSASIYDKMNSSITGFSLFFICLKYFQLEHKANQEQELAFQSFNSTFPHPLIESNPNGVDRLFPPRWAIIHLSIHIFLLAQSGLLYFSVKNDWINAEKQPPRRVENPEHRFRSCELRASSGWFFGGKINSSRARCSLESIIIVLMDFALESNSQSLMWREKVRRVG